MPSVEVDTAPATRRSSKRASRQLDRRTELEAQARERGAGVRTGWTGRLCRPGGKDSADLRETGRRLHGRSAPGSESGAGPGSKSGAGGRRGGDAGRFPPPTPCRACGNGSGSSSTGWRAIELQRPRLPTFRAAAASVEARAREQDTLPLHAEGYGPVTEMARSARRTAGSPAGIGAPGGGRVARPRPRMADSSLPQRRAVAGR